ncbi:MAG: SDR family oxidoreductase [Alphaproteobacteria bacterium]|nr:SDR family oxidoreductase [Alphaproteobacteria bacterium]
MTKHVLVTGANGFVGKRLCDDLLKAGFDVLGTVRTPETFTAIKTCEISDINVNTDWTEALKGIDCIVHLAARVHVMKESSENPLELFRKVNTDGTITLAEQAVKAGVKRFVFISTAKVNGEFTTNKPFTNNGKPCPVDPYSVSKSEAEQALYKLSEKIEMVILRPPLIYGEGVKGNFLSLMKAVYKGIPLPLGCIKNRRSLLYVGNLTSAIIECLKNPKAGGKTFLLCDKKAVSTSELVRKTAKAMEKSPLVFPVPVFLLKLAGKLTGKKAVIERLTQSLEIDGSEITETLGWKPPFSIEDGLADTTNWFCSLAKSKK